jgi:hypothetical protein
MSRQGLGRLDQFFKQLFLPWEKVRHVSNLSGPGDKAMLRRHRGGRLVFAQSASERRHPLGARSA